MLAFAAVLALQATGLDLGQPLPEFSLPGVDGKTHDRASFAADKILLFLFTCNHCPTAQAYEDRILKLDADYRARGVRLVAISPNDPLAVRLDELGYSDLNDTLEEMKLRAKHKGFTFPYLYDGETQALSRALGVTATPHAFVFDAERKLRYKGRLDDKEVGEPAVHELREALDDLLAGREVRVPKTRAFGCSTKWSDKRDGVAKADAEWAKREVTLSPVDPAGVKALAANPGEDWLLVNVWSTTCGPCVTEFPDLVATQRMFERRAFKMATIATDPADGGAEVLKFLKAKQAAAMKNLHYGGGTLDALAEALDPAWEGGLPYTVLVAPGGKVAWRHAGALDMAVLRKELADRLGRTYASRKPAKK